MKDKLGEYVDLANKFPNARNYINNIFSTKIAETNESEIPIVMAEDLPNSSPIESYDMNKAIQVVTSVEEDRQYKTSDQKQGITSGR